ncbi:hypothetical protein FOA52_013346 [Chlamydomonas sp. UWO 241]|nr:hypothetical protein FOA52_013346 [Chlamydomonas sp. UWO 241]
MRCTTASLPVAPRSAWGAAGANSSRSGSARVACRATPDKPIIAITGATGLVGSRLTAKLSALGYTVHALTRNPQSAKAKLPYAGVRCVGPADWERGLEGATGVVNLAGEAIATRWNPQLKQEIKSSRINVTNRVVNAIKKQAPGSRPSVFISASAVGFYGISQTATFNEDSPSGKDYLSQVCREWEAAAMAAPSDVRTCVMRTGIVLARDGGAVGKMLPVFQLFAGGPLGTGRQWMSWIHRDDLVELIIEALRNPGYVGTFNATAPKPVRMSEFCSTLGTIMGRPSWLPVPDFALTTLLGEGASVVLDGQKVLPTKTQQAGFKWQYNDIEPALRSVVN